MTQPRIAKDNYRYAKNPDASRFIHLSPMPSKINAKLATKTDFQL
jgi:hypothetical protein